MLPLSQPELLEKEWSSAANASQEASDTQLESGKDEGTGSVSATGNWHCTELTDCPGWPSGALTPGLLSQGIPSFPLPQAAWLKRSVGTDGWGTASRILFCWG